MRVRRSIVDENLWLDKKCLFSLAGTLTAGKAPRLEVTRQHAFHGLTDALDRTCRTDGLPRGILHRKQIDGHSVTGCEDLGIEDVCPAHGKGSS